MQSKRKTKREKDQTDNMKLHFSLGFILKLIVVIKFIKF